MQSPGSWPLLLLFPLSFLIYLHPSLAFSLKNCTIVHPEDANNVLVTCSKRGLTAVPDDIPRNVTSLELSINYILNITSTDLRRLSKLVSVQADQNAILHIADGAFADLEALRTLNLSYNHLSKLTDNMFKGLFKLVTLSLSSNLIRSISPLAFQSLESINSINLIDNYLFQIADIIPILKLPTLQDLSLGANWLTSFQSDDLPLNASNLTLLQLAMNPLRKFSIRRDIFPDLEILDLMGCNSMEWDIANRTFLSSLRTLMLGGVKVNLETYRAMLQTTDSIHEFKMYFMNTMVDEELIDTACQIPSLRALDVRYNYITAIDDNLLRSCSRLTELTVSFSRLSELSEHSLRSMTQLRRLALNNNFLHHLQLAVQGLSTLEILDLSTNSIGVLDCNDFHTLTRLAELDLSSNAISSLEGCVFQNLNNLKVLNIEENPVLTLNGALKVTLGKLESLNMHNNRLFELIQGDFGNLHSLRFLDLESSTFNTVHDGAFEGLDNLQTLSISVNDDFKKGYFAGLPRLENLTLHLTLNLNLKMVQQNSVPPFSDLPNLKKLVIKVYETTLYSLSPELLKGLTSLEYFMIEKLNMRSLHSDLLKYTPQLKDLHIVNSDLSALSPELFWPVPHLKALNLSSNKLMSLDFLAGANLTVLTWLKVSDNKLSIINETVFQSLPALTYVDLSGNVLACECSNAGFNQWVQSNNQTQVVNGHQYTCAFPVSQQGKKFLDFDTSYCWTDTAFLCFISSTCVTVFTLLTSFIYHFLRWHLVYSYYLFLAFLYDKKRRNQGAPHRYDAFVSYNVHDEAFVYREMLPVLEGEQGWRLCLHHRDFEPGKPIVENITDAIYGSRKTICVISRHYLQSEWCSREIQMASYRLFDEQEDVLILLFMEDIPAHQLSPYYQMRSLVRRRTYLSWQQAGQHTGVFWQKVQQALDTTERPAEHRHLVTGRPSCV